MAQYKSENEIPQLKAYITQLEEKLLEKERPLSSYSTATESSVPSSVVTGESNLNALFVTETLPAAISAEERQVALRKEEENARLQEQLNDIQSRSTNQSKILQIYV